jgi:hypothetical protein
MEAAASGLPAGWMSNKQAIVEDSSVEKESTASSIKKDNMGERDSSVSQAIGKIVVLLFLEIWHY